MPNRTLAELFAAYRLRNLRSASKDTIRLWQIALRLFDRHLGRAARTDDLNDDAVCGFSCWRAEHVAASTVNRDLASLLALWRWAHRRGIVTRWPDVPLLTEPKRMPVAWTEDEFNQLMATVAMLPGRVGRYPSSAWWKALLLTCFDSAERIGAVLSLRWDHVDLANGWIVFDAATRKGRREDLVVRVHRDTCRALRAIVRSEGLVFPWPWTRGTLWIRYGEILQAAELPADRRRKFHCIRRTTASHFEAAGGNATKLLGHASRRNTLAYLDPRITQPQQAIDLLWRPNAG